MPKLGRTKDRWSDNRNLPGDSASAVNRDAPFGNSANTPVSGRYKIIAGKMVYVENRTNADVQNGIDTRPQEGQQKVTSSTDTSEQTPPTLLPELVSRSKDDVTSSMRYPGSSNSFSSDSSRLVLPPISPFVETHNACVQTERLPATTTDHRAGRQDWNRPDVLDERPTATWCGPMNLAEETRQLEARIREELPPQTGARTLKDVYVRLTELDESLSGCVGFGDLASVFRQYGVGLEPSTVRMLSSMFASVFDRKKVHYENLLSFVARCLPTDHAQSSPMDDTSLRHLIEYQLQKANSANLIDFERVWQIFQRADLSRRDRFSRQQIKDLVSRCNLPLQEFVVDQMISRCNCSSGLYSWEQFLEQIAPYLSVKTSLQIMRSPVRNRQPPQPRTPTNVDVNSARQSDAERQLSRFDAIVQETRHRLNDRMFVDKLESMPWFERFMDMSRVLHTYAYQQTGFIDSVDARWLVMIYNKAYSLGLTESQIGQAFSRIQDWQDNSTRIPIEQLLKLIITNTSYCY